MYSLRYCTSGRVRPVAFLRLSSTKCLRVVKQKWETRKPVQRSTPHNLFNSPPPPTKNNHLKSRNLFLLGGGALDLLSSSLAASLEDEGGVVQLQRLLCSSDLEVCNPPPSPSHSPHPRSSPRYPPPPIPPPTTTQHQIRRQTLEISPWHYSLSKHII